jgi:tetratricopeptide (TPR) repeat protein
MSGDPFRLALAAFQTGDLVAAQRTLAALLSREPRHADGQHLAALLAKQQGRLLDALTHFEASLAANERQPVVHANFGNLLKDLNRYALAERHYRRAIELMPNFAEAWYQRGVLATERHQLGLAVDCLKQARDLKPDARAFVALGRAELTRGEHAAALAAARRLRELFPTDARGVALQARTLHAMGQTTQAIDTLKSALKSVDDPAALYYELGLLAIDANEIDLAISEFETTLTLRAEHIEAHRALNNLLWERKDERFIESYHTALKTKPDHAPLYHNMAAAYIASGAEREATRALEFAIERLGRDPFLLHGLGVQAMKHGNLDIARDFFEEALKVAPDTTRFHVDRANLHIQREEYDAALPHLEHARRLEPWNQEVWGYFGLLWRLTGDSRAQWLDDYPQLLRDYTLPTPTGYRDIDEFMSALAAHLGTRHTASRQPLDQSVRNGTQTIGILLDDPHPLLQALKESIRTCVEDYLGSLKADTDHPFLSRLPASPRTGWRFAGSWSVKLGSQGFHTNHVHPYGWLSCCNYIALPSVVGAGEHSQSGWIKFGETSLALGVRERIAQAIQPRVGHCVFFPAYFWHGTIPFIGNEPRLTVPCDFEPLH